MTLFLHLDILGMLERRNSQPHNEFGVCVCVEENSGARERRHGTVILGGRNRNNGPRWNRAWEVSGAEKRPLNMHQSRQRKGGPK